MFDNFVIINVYLPSIQSDNDLCTVQSIFAELDDIISSFPQHNLVLGGDLNTNICLDLAKNDIFHRFFVKFKIVPCNNFIASNSTFTYCHESLQHFSYIDFICISSVISGNLLEFKVLDLAFNLSDHCPVYARLAVDHIVSTPINVANNKRSQASLRWDHAQPYLYYDCTRELLQPLFDKLSSVYSEGMSHNSNYCTDNSDYGPNCDYVYRATRNASELNTSSRATLDSHYANFSQCNLFSNNSQKINSGFFSQTTIESGHIVKSIEEMFACLIGSLNQAADSIIHVVKCDFFKYWWNQELDELKAKSCSTHHEWIMAGRPMHGPVYDAKGQNLL